MSNEAIDLDRSRSLPIRLRRGQSIDKTILVKNEDGTDFDFTGYSADLLVYNSYNSAAEEFEIVVTLSTGRLRITHSPITRKRENFVYILWMTDPTNYRQPWTNGDFFVGNRTHDQVDGDETITITPDGEDVTLTISPLGGLTSASIISALGYTPQKAITFKDEGTALGAATVDEVDFAGTGVVATRTGNKVTVTIAGGLTFNPSRRILYKNNVSQSLTGTTNETLFEEVAVAGNTIEANDIINIVVTATKSGSNGLFTPRVRVSTTQTSIVGNVLLAMTSPNATNLWLKVHRDIILKNSQSSQIAFNNTSFNDDLTFSNTIKSQYTDNYANLQYFKLTGQLANASDTMTIESWYIEIIRT